MVMNAAHSHHDKTEPPTLHQARAPRILVVNAGSSSIKCGVYGAERGERVVGMHCDIRAGSCELVTSRGDGSVGSEQVPLPEAGETAWQSAVRMVLARGVEVAGGPVIGVGHRIVHGGNEFQEPVVITPAVLTEIEKLVPLAPLHQPHGLAAIRGTMACLPDAIQVACFDTAFHAACPPVALRFAIPRRWHDAGLRRYGFHGLSYESIVARLPEVAGGLPERMIVAHLGAGASLCAIRGGRSVATTMGFTPLDGLVMATRCGEIDPGAILHLIRREGLSPAEVEEMLWRESGLLGVSAESGDMRVLLESENASAAEAVELFCYRAVREIGSLTAALGGLDTLVFTAGIGEHAAAIRAEMSRGLEWLGVAIDSRANASHGPQISLPGSRVAVWVIPTDEEVVIANHTRRLVSRLQGDPSPLQPGRPTASRP